MPNERHPGRPPKQEWPPCKIEGCKKTSQNGGFGMCRAHYTQVHRGMRAESGELLRQPKRVRSYGPGARCIIEGCGNRPKARGLCNAHNMQRRLRILPPVDLPTSGHTQSVKRGTYHSATCLVEGCTCRPVSRSMCSRHAQQREAGIISPAGEKLRELSPTGRKRLLDRWRSSTRDGYILIVAPEGHPRPRADGSLLEHRYIMEQHIGRYLEEWEIVHHKNGDRSDNQLENLELLDGRARKGVGHPPGSLRTPQEIMVALEHLCNNDPEAYAAVMKSLSE